MKKVYRVGGDFIDPNLEILEQALQISDIKVRTKSFGEMFLENDDIDLHIYESLTSECSTNYLIGGTIEGESQQVEAFIKKMAALLDKNNVVYNFEFYKDCPPGEVSQEVVVRHPNF